MGKLTTPPLPYFHVHFWNAYTHDFWIILIANSIFTCRSARLSLYISLFFREGDRKKKDYIFIYITRERERGERERERVREEERKERKRRKKKKEEENRYLYISFSFSEWGTGLKKEDIF